MIIIYYLLDETLNLLDDFVETSTGVGWLGGVHLVDADNQLLDAQGVGQEGVFAGLTVLRDTGLEFSHTSSDNQYTTISLGCTCYLKFMDYLGKKGWFQNGFSFNNQAH